MRDISTEAGVQDKRAYMRRESRVVGRRERQKHKHCRMHVKYTGSVPIRGAPWRFVDGAEGKFKSFFWHRVMGASAHSVEDRLESDDLLGRRQEAT
jgi:hypothetical protein